MSYRRLIDVKTMSFVYWVSNNVTDLYAVRLATLSKRDSSTGISQPTIHRCSTKYVFWKIHKILRKAPVLECFFSKSSGLKPVIVLQKRLQHRCFFVSFEKFFKTSLSKNTSKWLLLVIPCKLREFFRTRFFWNISWRLLNSGTSCRIWARRYNK